MLFSICMLAGCAAVGFKSVDTQRFASAIDGGRVQLVDVRTPAEYAEGHIAGAINMDVQSPDFASRIATLDKGRKVAVYCRSGRRSKMAAEQLDKAGFRVIELEEGIQSWSGAIEK